MKLTIEFISDGQLVHKFETEDESWMETSAVLVQEDERIYTYASYPKDRKVIHFEHQSEALVKTVFNLKSLKS